VRIDSPRNLGELNVDEEEGSMARSQYYVINLSSCNVAAGTSKTELIKPQSVMEFPCYQATYTLSASCCADLEFQGAPFQSGPWHTYSATSILGVTGTAGTEKVAYHINANNNHGWFRILACATAALGAGSFKVYISHVREDY